MSRDMRKGYYNRDWERDRERERDRDRDREYRRPLPPKRSHSPLIKEEKPRSRSPLRIKGDKDMLDENILSEISKLPEPSELWEPNQFQDAGFAPPPPFQPPEPNPPYNNYPPQPYAGIYDDFPTVASIPPAPQAPDISSWNQLSLPPPPTAPPQFNIEEQIKKEAAIESEMRHQKAALSKQREDYMKKAGILKKELETLKDQRNELRGDPKRSPSPDTKRFLKENTKLQLEIQNKLKTINNVVDMLNGIIGEEAAEAARLDSDDSGEREKIKRKSRSPTNKKFNYVYYDPEMHWCRVCNEFPSTAKDYLNHLHSQAHQKMAAAHMEAPWHSVTTVNEGFPSFPSAPTKRTPIRGLQFFVPSTAWYCKLCDQFIGDLHCASAHLKSIVHSKNYTNFVEQNPHWETDWMSDRQKAFEKARGSKAKKEEEPAKAAAAAAAAASRYAAHTITFNKDGFHTKRKDSPPPPVEEKEKKKKKEKKEKKKKSKRKKSTSSSSSSSSSSSDSDAAAKKKKKRQADARLNESDRQLLDSLKSRMTRDRDRDREPTPRDSRDPRDLRDLRDRIAPDSRKRESDRRSDRSRESSRARGDSRARSPSRHTSRSSPGRKPEIRKMPFIGKMPVYKNLTKTAKTEEQKKEEQKKKEDDESTKKRREEMDAEIQKKVAEFKEKIAKAQIAQELGPPAVALPTSLGTPVPFLAPPAPPPPQPAALLPTPSPSNLSKDFQDALDIIFPSEVKKQAELAQQELFAALPFGPLGMPPFPLMQPPLMQPPQLPGMMMGFDMNPSLFGPRPSLYDTHVPLVPSPKPRQNKRPNNNNKQKQNQNQNQKNQNQKNQNQPNQNQQNQNQNQQNQSQQNQSQQNQSPQKNETQNQSKPPEKPEENGPVAKKKEELDELALLGIDAGDVAGM